jgi:hypothetical protein
MTKQVKNLMEVLGVTEEEALDIIGSDKEIDKGKKLFELNDDQKKTEKKMRQADRKPTAYKFEQKRERKSNDTKRWAMERIRILFEGFAANGDCEAVNLSNPEKTLDFTKNGKHYTLSLTEHRS